MKFSEKIKATRVKKNMTLKELALKSKLSIGHLSMIENDQREPSIEVLERIAKGLQIPLEYLLLSTIMTKKLKDPNYIKFYKTVLPLLDELSEGFITKSNAKKTIDK